MTAKIKGKTLTQHISAANKRLQWLKKIDRMLTKPMRKVSKFFTLSDKSLTPPKNGKAVVVLKYIGEADTPNDFMPHLHKLENILDCRFDANGKATITNARSPLTLIIDCDFIVPQGEIEGAPETISVLPMPPRLALVGSKD